jgi:hypothetical protein
MNTEGQSNSSFLRAAQSVIFAVLISSSLVGFYVGSLGPAVSLADRGYLPQKAVRSFYASLPRRIGMKSLRIWAHFDKQNFRDVIWEN